ncbi:MAG: TetR/AcrR family transcriptional regulator [Bacteroidota bacterium]
MSIKHKIIEESSELFMLYGIRSVSMDDVASKLGISKKTIYQYFDNKDDLVQQVTLDFIQKDLTVFNEIREQSSNSIEQLLNFAQYLMEIIRKVSPSLMYDLHKYHKDSWCKMEEMHKQYIYSTIKENIERGQAQDIYRKEMDAEIAARLYVATSYAVMEEDIFPMKEFKKDQVIQEFIHQFVHGWASDKGLELWKEYVEAKGQAAKDENQEKLGEH